MKTRIENWDESFLGLEDFQVECALTNAVDAEEMFTKLMGEEVEPRRQFIEDNALNVRNLDI